MVIFLFLHCIILSQFLTKTEVNPSVENKPDQKTFQQFQVEFHTSEGNFTAVIIPQWAPYGASRLYDLLQQKFFDGTFIFRVVQDRVAQFGISNQPDLNGHYLQMPIPDDKVTVNNRRGSISFANFGQPHTRFTQIFINLADNDFLNHQGFSPIGAVIWNMNATVNRFKVTEGEIPNLDSNRAILERNYFHQFKDKLTKIYSARILSSAHEIPPVKWQNPY